MDRRGFFTALVVLPKAAPKLCEKAYELHLQREAAAKFMTASEAIRTLTDLYTIAMERAQWMIYASQKNNNHDRQEDTRT